MARVGPFVQHNFQRKMPRNPAPCLVRLVQGRNAHCPPSWLDFRMREDLEIIAGVVGKATLRKRGNARFPLPRTLPNTPLRVWTMDVILGLPENTKGQVYICGG